MNIVSEHFKLRKRTFADALAAIKKIGHFIPKRELETIASHCRRSEEKEFFIGKLVELADLIEHMPKTYEQDGKGDEAIVSLHYFGGGASNWWITEKDSEPEQNQAFGLADLGYGAELGYISIVELCESSRVELDLYFTPITIGELKKQREKFG